MWSIFNKIVSIFFAIFIVNIVCDTAENDISSKSRHGRLGILGYLSGK